MIVAGVAGSLYPLGDRSALARNAPHPNRDAEIGDPADEPSPHNFMFALGSTQRL
jgi:hypothetical protein